MSDSKGGMVEVDVLTYEHPLEKHKRWAELWFYLQAHPEHVQQVVREALYGEGFGGERDRYGHFIG
jgi:hypothetical protein